MLLEFEECDQSGYLRSNGDKGTYWILDHGPIHLQRITGDAAGPNTEELGTFNNVKDAIEEANRLEGE